MAEGTRMFLHPACCWPATSIDKHRSVVSKDAGVCNTSHMVQQTGNCTLRIDILMPGLLACSATPIFFILFPGYSPSKEIEQYAHKLGKTVETGDLTLISMGQGQEGPAEAVLDK